MSLSQVIQSRFQTAFHDMRGEMIVEVLIALTVLVLGAFVAVRLMSVAVVNNQLTKERVIATNLSREGIEAVRNIRDTNWLRYAGERRRCWNNLDLNTCSDNDSNDVADESIRHQKFYVIKHDALNYRWILENKDTRLDLSDGVDEDYRLKLSDSGFYGTLIGSDSIYFREIYTEYLNDDGTGPTVALPEESANVLRVTSKTEWYDRGKISKVVLTTVITDYLGRADHN